MPGLRSAAALFALLLALALIWAGAQTGSFEDLRYEIQALFDQPWGVAALADLYAGLALMALVMIVTERSLIAGLLWAAPMLVLGNLWAAFWLLLRLPRLYGALRAG